MALGIPKVVQALFVQSTDASRVRDNIVTALQPVLDFLGQYFTPGNDGSLTIPRAVNATAGVTTTALTANQATVNGPLTGVSIALSGNLAVYGTAFFKAPGINGFVIQPGAVGPAFYVTNLAGNAALFVVYSDGGMSSVGQISGASVVSNVGFRHVLDMGTYWTNNYPGGIVSTVEFINNGSSTLSLVKRHVMMSAGSVTGLSLRLNGSVSAAAQVVLFINGTQLAAPIVIAAGGLKGYASYAKGTFKFVAGDELTCGINFGATGINQSMHADFEVELGA